jgi:hypothetical protein
LSIDRFHPNYNHHMRASKSVRPESPTAAPLVVSTDRRERQRLRDLCDEVIASFRVASGRDPISDQDRAEASLILPGMTPLIRT